MGILVILTISRLPDWARFLNQWKPTGFFKAFTAFALIVSYSQITHPTKVPVPN